MTSAVLAGLPCRHRSSRSASFRATTRRSASGAEQVKHKPGDRIVMVTGTHGGESIIDLDRLR